MCISHGINVDYGDRKRRKDSRWGGDGNGSKHGENDVCADVNEIYSHAVEHQHHEQGGPRRYRVRCAENVGVSCGMDVDLYRGKSRWKSGDNR